MLLVAISIGGAFAADRTARNKAAPVRFSDVPAQAAEFIAYARSVRLTPEQEKLRQRILSGVPAPCCDKYSAATCCCPCNLAKSIWGLASVLIARDGAGATDVEGAVRSWIAFVNPRGFTGNACDTSGGCSRRFSENGCGGMNEKDLRAAR